MRDSNYYKSTIDVVAFEIGVVAYTFNPASVKAKFRNNVGSISVGGNSPWIGGWIR